jgi:GNAT superfamily N-acetyltransferase
VIDALTQARVEKYWAGEFGCSVDTLRTPGSKVFIRDDPGSAFVFRYGNCCIWHVPQRFMSAVERSVNANDDIDQVFDSAFVAALFGSAVQRILGPCPIAYFPDAALHPDESLPPCRKLTETDAAAVERLAADCGPEAWGHGGVELDAHRAVFGCFADDRLVSAASYEIWGDAIAHVGVVTAPSYRGRRFGKAAATAATADALRQGLVPQWRTLESNVASVRLGEAIGYVPVAAHFFVRLAAG